MLDQDPLCLYTGIITFNILFVSFFIKTISILLIFLSLQRLKTNLFKGFLPGAEHFVFRVPV